MAAALAVFAGGASAQDFGAGLLGGNANALTSAAISPPGVIVSAVGRAKLSAASVAPFDFSIQGKGSSAVQALALRDARLKQVRAIAQQLGAEIEATDSGFSTVLDPVANAKRFQDMQAQRAAHPGAVTPLNIEAPPQLIVASYSARVRGLPSDRVAAFIDALRSAGVEDVLSLNTTNNGQTLLLLRAMGLSVVQPVEDIDLEAMAQADADAITKARREARDIAAAASRTLGPIEQVTDAVRTVQGDEAIVTVIVRFAFTPVK